MSSTGSTDRTAFASAVLLVGAGLLGGCSVPGISGSRADVPAAPEPVSAAVSDRYREIVARLATDAGAQDELRRFSADHPDLAGPLVNLALLEARAGRDERSLAYLAQASKVCDRCAPVWNEAGVQRRLQGHFADAERAYQKAIALDGEFSSAYFNLAVLYELYLQRPDLAVENYRRYLELRGDMTGDKEVAKWVADLERRSSSPAKAVRAEPKKT